MNKTSQKSALFKGPLLNSLRMKSELNPADLKYPFTLPIIKNLQEIEFSNQVTFFVGENGTGKSTLLEAIAAHAGFGIEGGSKNINFKTSNSDVYSGAQALADNLTLSWCQKPKDGYFFKAESFYNVANHIDYLERECGGSAYSSYGNKSLHAQSHGESFLSFFKNRIGKGGFYMLDEPEAALSPQRQLSLLVIINDLCKNSNTQFIIATHSPILLSYPKATIYSCDSAYLRTIEYTDTPHYQITKDFLNNTEHYLHKLLDSENTL